MSDALSTISIVLSARSYGRGADESHCEPMTSDEERTRPELKKEAARPGQDGHRCPYPEQTLPQLL